LFFVLCFEIFDFSNNFLIFSKKKKNRYEKNGLLTMLDRNRNIKRSPERFQETKEQFDVIICCEERCFDQVCEGKFSKFFFLKE